MKTFLLCASVCAFLGTSLRCAPKPPVAAEYSLALSSGSIHAAQRSGNSLSEIRLVMTTSEGTQTTTAATGSISEPDANGNFKITLYKATVVMANGVSVPADTVELPIILPKKK
ncbi:MAG TPA: hypothetical protein VGO11_03010 [Chthoniobacteraceae bacterium]|jgi:hypothetical protein|nr:hypothetical protein [Chthoniobacteraceae bacterium]